MLLGLYHHCHWQRKRQLLHLEMSCMFCRQYSDSLGDAWKLVQIPAWISRSMITTISEFSSILLSQSNLNFYRFYEKVLAVSRAWIGWGGNSDQLCHWHFLDRCSHFQCPMFRFTAMMLHYVFHRTCFVVQYSYYCKLKQIWFCPCMQITWKSIADLSWAGMKNLRVCDTYRTK